MQTRDQVVREAMQERETQKSEWQEHVQTREQVSTGEQGCVRWQTLLTLQGKIQKGTLRADAKRREWAVPNALHVERVRQSLSVEHRVDSTIPPVPVRPLHFIRNDTEKHPEEQVDSYQAQTQEKGQVMRQENFRVPEAREHGQRQTQASETLQKQEQATREKIMVEQGRAREKMVRVQILMIMQEQILRDQVTQEQRQLREQIMQEQVQMREQTSQEETQTRVKIMQSHVQMREQIMQAQERAQIMDE